MMDDEVAKVAGAASVECPRCKANPFIPCAAVSHKGGNWLANTHRARFQAVGIDRPTDEDRRQAIADFEYAQVQRHRLQEHESPYSRGWRDGIAGKTGPAFPLGDATWEQRLYERGWTEGRAHLKEMAGE